MGLCKDCKYYSPVDVDNEWDIKNLGTCDRVEMLCDAQEEIEVDDGTCLFKYSIKEEYKDLKAFTVDGEDYKAELHCFPDFGCVQFEQKEEGDQ